MFPWEGKAEFPDAVCYRTGITEEWTRSNVHTYSSRDQCCCCCCNWLGVLLTHLFLSLRGPRNTWLTCLLSPLWEDPDGSAWWPLTCPEGCLLVPGTKQLYFVTPPFQPQTATARSAQSMQCPAWLPWMASGVWARYTGENVEAQRDVNLMFSELQAQECYNNPNP